MNHHQNPAAGFFGKRSAIADIAHENICVLPDQDEFEEDFTSYLKRLAKESKEKLAAEV